MAEDYDIGVAIKNIEDELIASMIRNLDHHRAEETKEGYNWSQWQVEQLAALEEYKKRNAKRYKDPFKDINNSIGPLIALQRQAGNASQEIAILNAIRKGAKISKPGRNAEMLGKFFKANDSKINALIKATTDDMKKAETAILRKADDDYRKVIFESQLYANTGASYAQAVDMATKAFLKVGIQCIEYSNGARHTLSDYADMAIKTASKRAYLTGEGEKNAEWGISTVIINKRGGNPCPKCLPFVGKVLIDDVWSGGSSEDGPYPLMSSAMAAGLYHPRCKDIHTTYFPGISAPPDDTYTIEELNDIEEQSKEEAKEQYLQRQLEGNERLSKYSLDPDNKKKYQARADEYRKNVNKLSSGSEVIHSITPKVIDKVPKIAPNGMTEDVAKKLQAAHKELLEIAMNQNNSYEVAMMFGDSMSNIGIDPILGTISSVDLNVPGRSKAKYVLHNHPNNASFSNTDIAWLMNNDNVKLFSIVKNNGNVEIVYLPDDFDKSTLIKEYNRLVKKSKKAIEQNNQTGYNKVIEKLLTKSRSGIVYVR